MRLTLIMLFVFTANFSFCQNNFDQQLFKNLKFRNIGPAGMSGRITAIDVDLNNDERIFVGAASGGVWLSENNGISWKPVFDDMPTLAIGSIKINQNNPSEIWVGTGEGNPRNSMNTGAGIFKSLDGGISWKKMGLENTKTIPRIIINKDNGNIVYAASMGSPWGPTPDRGVYRTKDGGKSWEKILYVDENTGVADMVADPSNPNKIIAAMWEYNRTPWFFNSGGKSSGLYITYDGGDNWTRLTDKDGMPKGFIGRIGLAFAPSKPNVVYALIEAEKNGLYKSMDGGKKWELVSEKNIGDRPFYYSELYVDPKNENKIYNLYTYVSMSEDGGKTFKEIMNYGNHIHPDNHAWWIHPNKPDFLINGNDGGCNISRDGGKTWSFVSNLPVGQFYHVNVDNDFPYHVYGGMQDNGSWVGPSSVLKSGSIRNNDFQELYFGDGFDVVPYRKDSRYGFAMSQQGSVGYYDRLTGFTKYVQPVRPDTTMLRFNWNSAIAQDPFNDCGVYFGSQFLHYSNDCGDSWQLLSGDLTENEPEKQKQNESGGLTKDATGAENYNTILAIAPSPIDPKVIWVGTDDGSLQLTVDGGLHWQNLSPKIKGFPLGSWIPQIEISKQNAGEAFVVVNNYRKNDYTPYLFHTKDFGKTWNRLADAKNVNSFVLSIIQDAVEPNLLFLGADDGLYVSFDYGENWIHWTEGFPKVQVNDLKIQEKEKDLVIGTFGRALWILDDIGPLREIAKNQSILDKKLYAFEAPDAYIVSYRSYDGIRFYGQGEFTGDNDNIGSAMIGVWKKKSEKDNNENEKSVKDDSKLNTKDLPEKNKKANSEKLKIIILDTNGDTVRQFSSKLEDGFNRIYWGLERDGVEFPGRRQREEDADLPGGFSVLPGVYKLKMTLGDEGDSTIVQVNSDPRLNLSLKELEEKTVAYNEFYKTVKAAKKGYDLIVDARNSLELSDKMLVNQEDSIKTEIKELNKLMGKKLDTLELKYKLIGESKGIVRDPDNLINSLYNASEYLDSSRGALGSNGQRSIDIATSKTQNTIQAINDFYNMEWPKYKEKIESIQPRIFKNYKEVKIE